MKMSHLRAGLSLAAIALLLVAFAPAYAEGPYWTDSSGTTVKNSSGECWSALHGTAMSCHGAQAADSDGDGVVDTADRCPGTAAGIRVDANGCPLDSDNDGVADARDNCPGTPAGVKVDASGCPLDSDHDGVADTVDKCPNTPAGAVVDASGCLQRIVVRHLNFANDSAALSPRAKMELDRVIPAILRNPNVRSLRVTAYTDSSGAEAYNLDLSRRRAAAVRDYMIEKGIPAAKIQALGLGEANPVASNATSAGRAQNRRVEIEVNM